jgi:predicted nucleic acid-binding Zn ribbon protein
MRKTNEQTIADVLKQLVVVMKLKNNLTKVKIESLWAEKMGKTIAGYTRELSVREKILYVTIESASLRSELHYGREKIKIILNEAIGEDYLKEVIII